MLNITQAVLLYLLQDMKGHQRFQLQHSTKREIKCIQYHIFVIFMALILV